MVNDFIFELGCEELPSASVLPLANEFANNLLAALDKAQLSYGEVKRFATPRRIAVKISALQSEQQSQKNTRRGPAVNAAFDVNGNPTPALSGFAKSCGVEVEQLTRLSSDKGEWFVYESESSGNKTIELLPGLVTQALAGLTIPKPMRWGAGDDEFARPIQWAVMLYGDEVIQHPILGITSGRESRGHRFHHPEPFTVHSASSYESQLKDVFVVADFTLRRQLIMEQIKAITESNQSIAVMPEELLDEVTSIVEWPQALLAHFEEEFLEVPPEVLIASMQAHQKCFALKDHQGALLPYFITVANISSANPEQVILGNEKVMRARLSDAAFFFRQDKKNSLSTLHESTKNVVFQVKLGSVEDKTARVKKLMSELVQPLNLNPKLAERAAHLSKCDLMTGMVGEFPELQGLMGYYYALHDGEDKGVAQALNEQYMPRFAADNLPQTQLGLALSLADRIDTLVGIFGIGQKPSGVKDPFKLRRHALAVARLLIVTPASLSLSHLIEKAAALYPAGVLDNNAIAEIKPFILERMNSYYQAQELSIDLILAVRARQDEWLYDVDKRVNALQHFINLPESAALSAACKRVNNILNQVNLPKLATLEVNKTLLESGAEQALYTQMEQLQIQADALNHEAEYGKLLHQLASLREPVDGYFEQVMVMVDNEAVKTNRLALLQRLRDLLQGVADISLLQL